MARSWRSWATTHSPSNLPLATQATHASPCTLSFRGKLDPQVFCVEETCIWVRPLSSRAPPMPAVTPDTSQAPSTPTNQSNHLCTEPESDSDDEEIGECSMITWLSRDNDISLTFSDPNPPEEFEELNEEYFSRDQVRTRWTSCVDKSWVLLSRPSFDSPSLLTPLPLFLPPSPSSRSYFSPWSNVSGNPSCLSIQNLTLKKSKVL